MNRNRDDVLFAPTQTELVAYEKFPEPREVEVMQVTPNKKELGAAFKKEAKAITEALESLCGAGLCCCCCFCCRPMGSD